MPVFLTGLLFAATLNLSDLILPPGFTISIFARVDDPRQMALGDKGTVFVGSRREGKVYAITDENGDAQADSVVIIDEGMQMPSGVVFFQGDLYVADVNRILRYDDVESNLSTPPVATLITSQLPDASHHGWKVLAVSASGDLYVPVGVPCNICAPESIFGTILKMDSKTGHYTVFASGVRNSVGLELDPVDDSVWFTDNGRDWMGDNLPPDEINHAPKAGLHFGFPYWHGKNVADPEFNQRAPSIHFTPPVVELGAHVAPLGLMFYTGMQFPEAYRHRLLVAEHGSWNRSEKAGYRIIAVDKPRSSSPVVMPFVTGWLDKSADDAWGRPVDILQLKDGSILISDDYADVIYRVSYQQPVSGVTPEANHQ